MDGLTLLREARAAGLKVKVDGDLLRIRGPRRAEPVARRLLDNKWAVLKELKKSLKPKMRIPAWDAASATIIDWFLEKGKDLVPTEPFQLFPWVRVVNPKLFMESLLFEVSFGPDTPRNQFGALVADLRRLRELFGKDPQRGEDNYAA